MKLNQMQQELRTAIHLSWKDDCTIDKGTAMELLDMLYWVEPCRPCEIRSGYMSLYYCKNCSNIISKGDKYCSQCGKGVLWNE